jgi:signal transduction histidine kinase
MRKSEKLFFVFIIIILIPSIIFAYKAYRSIGDKRDTLLLKERVQINDILNKISEKTEEELFNREKVESVRPYYEYSYYFTPEGLASNNFFMQQSPLSFVSDDKLIMGYFQIDDKKSLTTPYFFYEPNVDSTVKDPEYKRQFLNIVKSKAYSTLIEELNSISPAPIKTDTQSFIVQQNYADIQNVYQMINEIPASSRSNWGNKNQDLQVENAERDAVRYYPIQYLYKKGGVFAYRKVIVKNRTYIQGYVINLVHLTDNILQRFISKNTPDNFSIYSRPLKSKRYYYASTSISGKLNFIKFYVYKNNNDYIDTVIKEEFLEYYISALALFTIIFLGCIFIHRTIKSEAEINRKKEDFVSAVTHELKSPLTSIRMYSEMLHDDMVKDGDKKKVYYNHMLKESERLTRLIDNVLDFSKIENNKKVFNMVRGSLKDLFLELCEKYKNNLNIAGFIFTYEIDDVKELTFDKDAMTQVFINLIDNAVKYSTSSKQKEIYVKLYENQDNIFFEITDKGIGMPRGEHKTIFNKFYRIENELTRTSKGSGIGLSIVKEYVKAHGGTIEAESKEGDGAKFKITLPKNLK